MLGLLWSHLALHQFWLLLHLAPLVEPYSYTSLMRCCSGSGLDSDIDMPIPESNPWHEVWRDGDVCCFHSMDIDQCRFGIRYRFSCNELLYIFFGDQSRAYLGCGFEGECDRVRIRSG